MALATANWRGIARVAFVPPWTAAVTASAVGLARLTRNESWVLRGERLWANGLVKAWQVVVDVHYAEPLDPGRPYVVMANHASYLDVPLLFMALPFVPGFIAKEELDKVPFLSMALRAGGHVLLDRSDRSSAMRALKKAAAHVRGGKTVAVFPEGTRGDGRELAPFKKGGFLIARHAGASILPVGIRGSSTVLPRGRALPRGGTVAVHVGAPIPTNGADVEALVEKTRTQIAELAHLGEKSQERRDAVLARDPLVGA